MKPSSSKAILSDLVAFQTVSGFPTEKIENYILATVGDAASKVIVADYCAGGQRNISFCFGPTTAKGIMLSGHTDVVPVEDQVWDYPPFQLTEEHGRLYGRGTCDMKGFLACMLSAVPSLAVADLKRPIWLTFTCEEEPGCLGLPYLLEEFQSQNLELEAVIVGEPSEMAVIDRHKGGFVETVSFHGISAHSSMPWLGVSANEFAIRFGARLLDVQAHLARQVDDQMRDELATINLSKISGGTAHNILADRCDLMWSLRCPPGDHPDVIIDDIREIYRELEVDMKDLHSSCSVTYQTNFDVPPLSSKPSCHARELVLSITGQNDTKSVNYGTEGGLYQSAEYPTVVCGPGSIDQAHKADEWISLDQLTACDEFISKLISRQSR